MDDKQTTTSNILSIFDDTKIDTAQPTPALLDVTFDLDLYQSKAQCWLKGNSESLIQQNKDALIFSINDFSFLSFALEEPYESDNRFLIEAKRSKITLIESGEGNVNGDIKIIEGNQELSENDLTDTVNSYFGTKNEIQEKKSKNSVNYYEIIKKYIDQYTICLGVNLVATEILKSRGVDVSKDPYEDTKLTIELNTYAKTLKFCNEIILYDGVELKARDNSKKNQRSDIKLSKSEDREKIGKIKITYIVNNFEIQQPKFDKIFIDLDGRKIIQHLKYVSKINTIRKEKRYLTIVSGICFTTIYSLILADHLYGSLLNNKIFIWAGFMSGILAVIFYLALIGCIGYSLQKRKGATRRVSKYNIAGLFFAIAGGCVFSFSFLCAKNIQSILLYTAPLCFTTATALMLMGRQLRHSVNPRKQHKTSCGTAFIGFQFLGALFLSMGELIQAGYFDKWLNASINTTIGWVVLSVLCIGLIGCIGISIKDTVNATRAACTHPSFY